MKTRLAFYDFVSEPKPSVNEIFKIHHFSFSFIFFENTNGRRLKEVPFVFSIFLLKNFFFEIFHSADASGFWSKVGLTKPWSSSENRYSIISMGLDSIVLPLVYYIIIGCLAVC